MDKSYEGRRGKRRVKFSRNRHSSIRQIAPSAADLLKSFVPVNVLASLCEMTCTMSTGETTCSYVRCSSCPQAFCSEDALREHVNTEHSQSDDGSVVLVEEKRPTEPPFNCYKCAYVAPDYNRATVHEKLHADKARGVSVFRCAACQFLSCSKIGLTIHKRLEHAPRKYECPMCNYASFNARHVTAHVDKIHCSVKEVDMEYDCPYCDEEFEKGYHLKDHLARDHVDESLYKEFACNKCEYIAHTNTDITTHTKAHQTKKKLFRCAACSFITPKFDLYAKHVNTCHDEDVDVEGLETEDVEPVSSAESGATRMSSSESGQQPNIPVIRVIQKKEYGTNPDVVDIDNLIYTPPTSPHLKSDPGSPHHLKSHPGNIFDKINLKNLKQEKDKIIMAVGLRQSPRKKTRTPDYKPMKLKKARLSSGHFALKTKTIKRCRYCTTKTMFDTVSKLREHHRKAHGIADLDLQFQLRTFKCKYCTVKHEYESMQELKEHYQHHHPQASLRKLVRKPRKTNSSNESDSQEVPKVKPSLIDQIEMAEVACEPARQDMLDCILQSQKQIGQTLQDFNPDFEAPLAAKIRSSRQNSAPDILFDRPPSVKPVIFSSDYTPLRNSAPSTPIIAAPPPYEMSHTPPKILPEIQIPTIPHLGTSILNLSVVELQYLQQCYIYQAQCINLYNTDPIYRQYVHDRQREIFLQSRRKELEAALHELHAAPAQRPMVTISDSRSLAPSAVKQPKLKLTKPKLDRSPKLCDPPSVTVNECFVGGCSFVTERLSDLKRHITEQHQIRITGAMMADLEKQIKKQETSPPPPSKPRTVAPSNAPVPPPQIPNVTIDRTYKCTHCLEVSNSFDCYVQHIMEAHRSELGIVSQGTQPNTFSTTYSPTKALSTGGYPRKREMMSPPTMLNMMPSMPSPATTASPATSPCIASSSSSPVQVASAGPAAFECTSCYYVGHSAKALAQHERIHSGIVYQCPHCEYEAATQATLKIHMNLHKT